MRRVRSAWGRVAGTGPMAVYAVAHSLAAAADAFVAVSLAGSLFFNISPEASRIQVLLYLAITMAPFALLAPLIGPAVDRYRGAHRRLASLTFAVRALAAFGLAFKLFELTFYVLVLTLLVAGKASAVVRQALIPRFVDDPAHLVSANSRLNRLGTIVAGIAGVTAAALTPLIHGPGLLIVASVLFAAAAGVVWALPVTLPHRSPPQLVEYAELHTPTVVVASAGLMALRAGIGYFTFMLAFALRRSSQPVWVYGLTVASYTIGSFLGNVLAPVARRRVNEETLMAASLVGAAGVCALGVLGVNRASLTALALVLGLAATGARLAFDSLLQRAAPDALRGQAFARYETRFQLTWVLGALVATAVVLPMPAAMAVLTALFVPAVVIYVRGARAALRFEPALRNGPIAPAESRLEAAVEWLQAGRLRHALVEASAAIDLARAAGASAPPDIDVDRVERLRRHAVHGDVQVTESDVDEAIRIARSVLALTPPEPPMSPPTPADPPSP